MKKNIIIIVLAFLLVSLGCYVVYDKVIDTKDLNNKNNSSNSKEQKLIESLKITNLTFNKPYPGSFGGSDINTLVMDVNTNLDCADNNLVGIELSGYCLDKNNNKYIIEGPVGVMAFYCDNNVNHIDSQKMQVNKVFDSKNNEINTSDVEWKGVDIKYCKINSAKLMLTNGESLSSKKQINYERNF